MVYYGLWRLIAGWDKFSIPLPFNRIELHVYDPLLVNRKDLENEAIALRKQVLGIMK
ncbi:hypothetical protein [Clostridium sp.]|uniref:hypothetical protein n=1 Tax=Clostridium sp. TaxID=1506 RepID=UPI003D6DA37E